MFKWQVGDQSRFAEITLIEHAAGLDVTTGQKFSAALIDLFGEIFEVVVGVLIDDRTKERGGSVGSPMTS